MSQLKLFVCAALLAGLFAVAGCRLMKSPVEQTSMETDLRIRVTGRELHPVHENLFGQFLEKPSWSNETGPEAALLPGTNQLDPRVERMMQTMDIPVVRFPGGTDVDYVDWRDMVTDAHGPGSGRPNSAARHPEPIVTNAFGYDEYGQLAERLGWKTILVVNLRDGLLGDKPPEAAAEHAAALLAYYAGEVADLPEAVRHWPALRAANGHPHPYALEYVQIGNESWFWTEELKKKYGDEWVTASADCIELFIAAIRRVVPNVRIIADAHPLEIAAELSRRNAQVDLYALHRYYPMGVGALYGPSRPQPESAPADPLSDEAYTGAPSSHAVIGSFEGPTNSAQDYNARYRGYVTAPLTGLYRFTIASDDRSVLLLGGSADPALAKRIAAVSSWTRPREWAKEPGQQSEAIPLQADERYYIEVRHNQGGGGDNLAVRWELPDGMIEEPIPGHRLEPFVADNSLVPSAPGTGILREVWSNTLSPENVTARQIWDTLVHSTQTDESGLAVWQDGAIDQARRLGYKLAATEWNLNGWWQIGERRELWPGLGGCGMGAAVMLQAMMRTGEVIALGTQSMLVGKSWGITGIRVAPDGAAAPVYLPTAEVTTLYRRHHGDRRLQVDYETPAPMWHGEVFFGHRVTQRAAIVDVLATRDDRNLYLHILNTDYDRPHRLRVRFDDLPVAGGAATLHRLRFLTRDEVRPGGAWTLAETDAVPVGSTGFVLSAPCRSATIVVIPLPMGAHELDAPPARRRHADRPTGAMETR